MSFSTGYGSNPSWANSADPRYTRDIRQILQRATELCAQGLDAPFAKVLEYMPDAKRLLIRAGVGWHAGSIDHVSLGADVESLAGYAFHSGRIVISNHLQEETRFRTPRFLADHGIKARDKCSHRAGRRRPPAVRSVGSR